MLSSKNPFSFDRATVEQLFNKAKTPLAVKGTKVLLLYSGGSDTTCLSHWLSLHLDLEVILFTANVGFIDNRSITKTVSDKHVVVNLEKKLVEKYAWLAIRAGARVGNIGHPICSSLSRAIISRAAADYARQNDIHYVMHGATSRSNDIHRFQFHLEASSQGISVSAPMAILEITRPNVVEYLSDNHLFTNNDSSDYVSIDENVWGIELEGGEWDDFSKLSNSLPFIENNKIESMPDCLVAIRFHNGSATHLNGEALSEINFVRKLNMIGLSYGIGIFDHLEARPNGKKVREIHISPAACLLYLAYSDLKYCCLDDTDYSSLEEKGKLWSKSMLHGFGDAKIFSKIEKEIMILSKKVSGEVYIELRPYSSRIVGRRIGG